MRAARVVGYHQGSQLTEVPEPRAVEPFDVVVRIAGAGICRTDVHILQGHLAEAFHPPLPYTIGHENAGRIEAVGTAVEHLPSATRSSSIPRSPADTAPRADRATRCSARTGDSRASTAWTAGTPS